jgi:hypothetical protein
MLLTVSCVEVRPEAAYGPLHALAAVKVGCVLLDGHVGEVDVSVADVLLLHAEAAVGEASKATPVAANTLTQQHGVTHNHQSNTRLILSRCGWTVGIYRSTACRMAALGDATEAQYPTCGVLLLHLVSLRQRVVPHFDGVMATDTGQAPAAEVTTTTVDKAHESYVAVPAQ